MITNTLAWSPTRLIDRMDMEELFQQTMHGLKMDNLKMGHHMDISEELDKMAAFGIKNIKMVSK